MAVRVGIIGASGFTGAELLRLLAGHPEMEVVVATGDSQAGTRAADLYPSLARRERDLGALHPRQRSQHLVNAIDAATAGHAGDRQGDFVHFSVPQQNN